MLWHPLDHEWQGPLVEGQSVALTAGYLSLTPDQKYGSYYCISSGDFGPEPLSSATAVGRGFRFRITGAIQASLPDGSSNAECSGAPVAASLSGCIYRTSTYLPANTMGSGGAPGSGGSGGTSANGSGGSSGSAPTAPDGNVQSCFGTACPNGECDNENPAQAPCSTSYTGPVTANSSYCGAGATGAYCIVVGPDAFNITTWVIDCMTGTATLQFCPTGCGTTNSSKVPTCE